jgi:CBS domain containing-hemolysin-like protein
MNNVFFIISALMLVLLNGFFVAAEFSLVKLRPTRIRAIVKSKGYLGRILAKVHGQLDAYLSACQLGITLTSLGLGWIGEPAFANLLEPIFLMIGGISSKASHAISFICAFFTISYLHIVAGELAPKSMAIRNPEKIGLLCALPLYWFYWAMYPAIWVLNASAAWVLRKLGLGGDHYHDTHYSIDELKLILRSSRPPSEFDFDEWKMMAHTVSFSKLMVSDLMRPAHELVALSAAKSLAENLQIIQESRFSRFPYFDQDSKKVLGMIHLKDLFLAQQQGTTIQDLQAFLRPVQVVAARMPALELFQRFRKGASQFVLVAETGQDLRGFLTFDNLLSALVGEIRDEFRQNDNDWVRLDDGTLIGKGSLPIYTLERALGIDIEPTETKNVDSVGGLIMAKLGDIPIEKQEIVFTEFSAVVEKMDGPRIIMVLIYPKRDHVVVQTAI